MCALERRWDLDGRTCAEAATAGNASGSTARSDRTSARSADATTIDDRSGQSSTNSSYPNCPRRRGNLVDLRVAERSSEWIRNLETFLEEWEPAHKGRYRAMLMQLLQFPFTGDRGQALEEWERLVRQYEAQSSDTLQDTIKAAILAHNQQNPEWRRHVGLNATRLQGYDALRSEWKAMHQAYRQWSIADGNDTTPMEVDALMRQREKQRQRQGQREGQRERQSKEQGQDDGRKIRHVEYEVFLLQRERPRPKGLPQVLGLAR